MKRLILISFVAALALAQTTIPHGDIQVTADRQEAAGAVRRLSGHVSFETDGMLLQTDQADFNESTGEIVAHGEVRVRLK